MPRDIKKMLIDATIELIRSSDNDISQIKIQDICGKANVAVGLVNYHFQTKENLLSKCLQIMIESSLTEVSNKSDELQGSTPLERLRNYTKQVFFQIEEEEEISKASILPAFVNFYIQDNMTAAVKSYFPLIKDIYPDWSDAQITEKAFLYNITLEGLFLRGSISDDYLTLNYQNPTERNQIIDKIIDYFFTDKSA